MQDEENKDLRALVAMRDEKIDRVTALAELTTQAQKKKLKKERGKKGGSGKRSSQIEKIELYSLYLDTSMGNSLLGGGVSAIRSVVIFNLFSPCGLVMRKDG